MMRRAPLEIQDDDTDSVSEHGTRYDSYLSNTDFAHARCLRPSAGALLERTSSLELLLNHLETPLRGAKAPTLVNGLKDELLPFQAETLHWALKHERDECGIQRLFWTKLPGSNLYYDLILGRLSTSHPNLVRGGFIAEQRDIDRVIVSLALILTNPAPSSPKAGSPASDICATPPTVNIPFWDPNLHGRQAGKWSKSRGSILSKGTHVVVSKELTLIYLCSHNWL